ncbi:MAG TPA: methyltransferase domain-containing protein [Nitrososphaerales archaeon]|jgi:release factor glutamine methyltransferase|nr:methyltransferase [Nitrososphaerota archaeon]HIM82845.1 methyltransferase domain-containing protein [Nitrososphaerales archaeon]
MSIYQPSDDSDLLCESILTFKNKNVLEIGIGSGIILRTLSNQNNTVIGIDINPESLSFVSSSLEKLNLADNVDLVLGDGPSMFVSQTFDLIVFNPPYLPRDAYTDTTTDGGNTGLEITDNWIKLSLSLIKKSGKILFLQSNLTPIHEYIDFLSKSASVNIVAKKKLFFEELYIIEVMHNE